MVCAAGSTLLVSGLYAPETFASLEFPGALVSTLIALSPISFIKFVSSAKVLSIAYVFVAGLIITLGNVVSAIYVAPSSGAVDPICC